MTTQVTATCQYCHATLPYAVSLAEHYATCTVLDYCLGPKSPFPGHPRLSAAEKASRANEHHGILLARARLKASKHG